MSGYPCCCNQVSSSSSSSTSSTSIPFCCYTCNALASDCITDLYLERYWSTGYDGSNPGTIVGTQIGASTAVSYVNGPGGEVDACAKGWTVPMEFVFTNNPETTYLINGTAEYDASVTGRNYSSGAQIYFDVVALPLFLTSIFNLGVWYGGDFNYPNDTSEPVMCSGGFSSGSVGAPPGAVFGSLTLAGSVCDQYLTEYRMPSYLL